MAPDRCVTTDNVNRNLLAVRYAVRGPVVDRALQLQQQLDEGVRLPFARVLRGNLADCHALGQKPITFIRQVVALAAHPPLLASPDFPPDAKQRARDILQECLAGSVGAYSPAAGLAPVRRAAAAYLAARDGVPASWEDIHVGSGASDLVKTVLSMFTGNVDGKPAAVMIPVPQYPLFSGTLSELGLRQVDCFLDEQRGWALSREELDRSWRQVLPRQDMEIIIKFAYERKLFLLADEVYQENIISKPFHSFKKVMHEMGPPYSEMELASFVTVSKGWAAECGLRAGFVELVRLQREVLAAFSTARSLLQCASVLGQCALHCVVRPPAPGEPSHELFAAEQRDIRRVQAERAAAACSVFSSIPGYSWNTTDGPMFAFPRVLMSESAQRAARGLGLAADEFYCLRLLEETGVCATPGSGFGQLPGTWHYRITFPYQVEHFEDMLVSVRRFHSRFLEQYP